MHRTQISLEERQHELLMRLSRREGISLSALVRRIADDYIEQAAPPQSSLRDLAGIASGDGSAAGREHDRHLYPAAPE